MGLLSPYASFQPANRMAETSPEESVRPL
jgi:hypothetical protein